MQEFLLQNVSPEERKAVLEKVAASTESITYNRHMTSAEIDAESKKLAAAVTVRTEVEQEKAAEMKAYNDRIKHLKETADEYAETLTRGTKEVTEKCYKLINFDTREVGYYNEHGELVRVRPATDADMQLDMFSGAGNAEARQQAEALTTGEGKALEAGDNIEDVDFEDVQADE